MAKYILIYKSAQKMDMTKVPKEQITQVMKAWGEWLGAMGPSVVDRGDMFKTFVKSVSAEGIKDSETDISGYSIIEVENYDAALEAAAGSPIIKNGGRVEVYEAFGI